MNIVKEKALAKINLGLDIISKRDDGYHEVSMVMHSIDLYDEIIIKKNEGSVREYFTDSQSLAMDASNLVCKAAELFCKEYGIESGFSIELKKKIPMAAGLAGGSSDAAAVLRGLNKLFELGISTEELMRLGKQIGADVPYCVMSETALAEGIGEIITKIPAPCKCGYLIVKPNVDVSTKWAYDEIDNAVSLNHPDIKGLVDSLFEGNQDKMASKMGNVFEDVIIKKYPIIKEIKDIMEACGAKKALMSGSGPTVFGIFNDKEAMEVAEAKINLLEHECIYKIW